MQRTEDIAMATISNPQARPLFEVSLFTSFQRIKIIESIIGIFHSVLMKPSNMSELLTKLCFCPVLLWCFSEDTGWTTRGLHWQLVQWKYSRSLIPCWEGKPKIAHKAIHTTCTFLNIQSHFELNNNFYASFCDYVNVVSFVTVICIFHIKNNTKN